MKQIVITVLTFIFCGSYIFAQKPRVIIATDPIELNENYRFVDEDISPDAPETGDPDDMQSLVRFLLYANEFQIEGIIASSERIDDGKSIVWVNRDYSIKRMIDKYDEVDENLRLHDPNYPTANYLRSKIRKGFSSQNRSELPGPGKDTPGSDLIIDVVDSSNELLWFLDWVGQPQQFELSQALWRVREERSAEEFAAFISKIRAIYTAVSRDGPGGWLRDNFPDLFLTGTSFIADSKNSSGRQYYGMSQYYMDGADALIWNLDWANRHLRTEHGALGTMFPSHTNDKKPGVNDYDSRTFFYLIQRGLGEPSDPSMGSWGGRYFKVEGTNHWAPAQDNHPTSQEFDQRMYYSVGRYQYAMQADFQARMDWCVRKYEEANHNPVVALNGDLTKNIIKLKVTEGDTVKLNAAGSKDPDSHNLAFRWWQYEEAGTYSGSIIMGKNDVVTTQFIAPEVSQPRNVHIILEVSDSGIPSLTSYRRIVVEIHPKK